MKQSKPVWISENEAAKMLGYTNLNWFRRLVKKRELPINYSSVRGRTHLYNQVDIETYIYENSTIAI